MRNRGSINAVIVQVSQIAQRNLTDGLTSSIVSLFVNPSSYFPYVKLSNRAGVWINRSSMAAASTPSPYNHGTKRHKM